MVNKEKRKVRGYKATDKVYKKAVSRAKKDKTHLSQVVERVITAYGNGFDLNLPKINIDELSGATKFYAKKFGII